MKKSLLLLFTILFGSAPMLYGQYANIKFDLEKNYFNEGQALPADKPILLSGTLPSDVNIVEVHIFPEKAKKEKDLLYLATWKDIDDKANDDFTLAINYELRSSSSYDFRIDYYKKLSNKEQEQLRERLLKQLDSYLQANIQFKKDGINLLTGKKNMIEDLEAIITSTLANYRNPGNMSFVGLSNATQQGLEKLSKLNFDKDAEEGSSKQTVATAEVYIGQVRDGLESEIRELLANPWSTLTISRDVDNYKTEKKSGTFSINAGFGGVYLEGNLKDLSYGAAPYIGVALPFSKRSSAPKLLQHSSIVLGAFLQNFEDNAGNAVGGFIINRPLYLGLDYRLFEFIHFNAGGVLLEKSETFLNTGGMEEVKQNVLIRPFIGLSARIDLSVRFGD